MKENITPHRCGCIAIIGRPNVGKSTLMNHLIGAKVSITSKKAQTTRHRIRGIQTTPQAQYIYIDTPGFQVAHTHALNKVLNRTVTNTLGATHVILFVVEAGVFNKVDEKVLSLIGGSLENKVEGESPLLKNIPCILVINKADKMRDKALLMPFVKNIAIKHPFTAVVPVSATTGFQLAPLQQEIQHVLPFQPPFFGQEDLTDRSEKFLAADIVREKLFRLVGNELPYTSTVLIEKFEYAGNLRRIFAVIMVARDSHKLIVIGKKGERIKKISIQARQDCEKLFEHPVYLEVYVKVKSGWADDEARLRAYGYED